MYANKNMNTKLEILAILYSSINFAL